MKKVAVVTDSNSGITQDAAKQLGIHVMPMPFFVNGDTFYEDINMDQDQFYVYLEQDAKVTTSQPSPDSLIKLWDSILEEYEQMVYIPMSSELSSACASAMSLAADDYEGKVYVVDNQRISVTQKHSVLEAIELADKGYDAKMIHDILIRDKFESSIYIMLDTLTYLKKGGRLTPAAAAIGTLLRIKPVLQIQGEKLDVYSRVKTLTQGKNTMMSAIRHDFEERFRDPQGEDFEIMVAYTKDDTDARLFASELEREFPGHKVKMVDPLSLSVSCHIGPGALAVAISRKISELQ